MQQRRSSFGQRVATLDFAALQWDGWYAVFCGLQVAVIILVALITLWALPATAADGKKHAPKKHQQSVAAPAKVARVYREFAVYHKTNGGDPAAYLAAYEVGGGVQRFRCTVIGEGGLVCRIPAELRYSKVAIEDLRGRNLERFYELYGNVDGELIDAAGVPLPPKWRSIDLDQSGGCSVLRRAATPRLLVARADGSWATYRCWPDQEPPTMRHTGIWHCQVPYATACGSWAVQDEFGSDYTRFYSVWDTEGERAAACKKHACSQY